MNNVDPSLHLNQINTPITHDTGTFHGEDYNF